MGDEVDTTDYAKNQPPEPVWYERIRVALFGKDWKLLPLWLISIDIVIFFVFFLDYFLILIATSNSCWYLTSIAGVCHLVALIGLLGTTCVYFCDVKGDPFFNVYSDLIYQTDQTAAKFVMLAGLSCRMFSVGYLDNLYPSIRMVADSVGRY